MQLVLRAAGILGIIVSILWWFAKPSFDPLYAFLTGLAALLTSFVVPKQEARVETLDQRNRRVMLNHVENFWVKGVLEKSLHGAALLELGIKEEAGAVNYPWTIKKEATDEILPAGKSMLEIFEEIGMGRSLLILGTPGSGKTTMLLELARQLIECARRDETEPIPVVFNLASWREKETIADWLAEQLHLLYYVPKKTAPKWIVENRMLLLLDGLDEVKQDNRAKCIEAINRFRRIQGLTSVVVCCRVEEYSALDFKLSLEGAITLQPLTSEQIDAYFDHLGKSTFDIKQLLQMDKVLRELAETPLMLSIMTLAYKDRNVGQLLTYGNRENQRKHLFDMYIMRMFERSTRATNRTFSKLQTLHYLSWLARRMIQHNISTYQIEVMQSSWLINQSQRKLYQIILGLFIGLLGGLISTFILGPIVGLAVGLLVGLVFGLLGLIIEELINTVNASYKVIGSMDWGGRPTRPGENLYRVYEDTEYDIRELLPSWVTALGGLSSEIAMVDKMTWSWKKAIGGLSIGLIIGLGVGLILRPLSLGLSGLIGSLGFALLGALLGGLTVEQIEEATRVGQRLRQTFYNSILASLASGIIIVLISGLLIGLDGLSLGLLVGLLAGLSLGGRTLIQHYLLRSMLSWNKFLPQKLILFLDYGVDLIFLRRVGGGYIFVHRWLMEHFAEMELPPDEPTI